VSYGSCSFPTVAPADGHGVQRLPPSNKFRRLAAAKPPRPDRARQSKLDPDLETLSQRTCSSLHAMSTPCSIFPDSVVMWMPASPVRSYTLEKAEALCTQWCWFSTRVYSRECMPLPAGGIKSVRFEFGFDVVLMMLVNHLFMEGRGRVRRVKTVLAFMLPTTGY
jgi:hypothetical protein